ncbi:MULTISPECIES: XrtA/PEP-CTERM system histidine kinase PrsK [unclassified Colwellia]|uniref:XrtA/PEP-CTERM system histidine kinase PrsK n=1 Tax=unclassified Colwellia TaxID=196834 RepID=UPI0015F5F554|nr:MULTISPECIES: XrtA/PEP-CTERM system histidine kinase PrsK [unclassified Colwellia]MBA6357614.1 PEP-CTERM system histidine kinase PrsK [Colwellia sp. BRX8-3]MBA6361438.1 PEP-CTERM system histidine kinase PrsK [Colwellia sp. BRX8-6]MBA6369541.1 PEP-CTERM system histidine kinase PrsK [Colwellia sp. BRX8-5]MBA6376035.1 PEP-CTERM system histidine kinase PrsK [Colwellia sp. BRX8-2]
MDSLGLFGYSLAGIAYLVFALLIFAARNKTTLARWVLVSVLVTVIANGVAALQIKLGFSLQWAMLADGFKVACWSLLILLCNTEQRSFRAVIANSHIRQYIKIWTILMVACWLASVLLNYSYEYLFLLFIVLNLWSLVLLEQLYRSADSQVRWAIWPMVIALASVAIFDFVLYAQATMVDGIDFDFWFSRGFISLIVVPLLLISTRRIRNGAVRIFVSRHVVFYSSMLMIAGIYLLVMAFAGYVINYIGGEWGSVVSIGFLMLSALVLVALFITESLRRKLKVFIAKNFFANKYEYRDEWLNLIGKIETTNAESYYQMATQIMMSKVNAYAGAILKKVTGQRFSVQYSEKLLLDDAFNQQLVECSLFCQRQGWIIDVEEYRQTPTVYPGLSLDLSLFDTKSIRIIVPIFIGKAFYGMFILAGKNQVKQLNWEDRDLLFAISKQLGNFVSLHEANDKLAESKQFDAFNRMSAFLVHDLKNVQAQLALITSNAEKHRDNPEFIADVFETVESATERLSKVLSQLRNKQAAQSKSELVDISAIINSVIEQRNIELPKVTFDKINHCEMAIDNETFHSVLNHLIQNAQEATSKDGWVKVELTQIENHIGIKISDNGCGMSADFINNRLFKPFDTTKGNAGMGIGVFEAKQFVEGIAGIIKVESIENKGTVFIIDLPINPSL